MVAKTAVTWVDQKAESTVVRKERYWAARLVDQTAEWWAVCLVGSLVVKTDDCSAATMAGKTVFRMAAQMVARLDHW